MEHPDPAAQAGTSLPERKSTAGGSPADGYAAWASSDGSIDGLAEATAVWSDTNAAVA